MDAPEAAGRAMRACNLRGIVRTSRFHGICVREVNRGNSVDSFGGPMTPSHAICDGLWPQELRSGLRFLWIGTRPGCSSPPPCKIVDVGPQRRRLWGRNYFPRLVTLHGGRRIRAVVVPNASSQTGASVGQIDAQSASLFLCVCVNVCVCVCV